MSVLGVRDFAAPQTETKQMRPYGRSLNGGTTVNERELAKLAEYQDEDALHYEDFDLADLLKKYDKDATAFKEKYGEYYDDIKFKEKDWW